jgi:hypothetical protein
VGGVGADAARSFATGSLLSGSFGTAAGLEQTGAKIITRI